MQACFCFAQSVASSRWAIQDEQHIRNTVRQQSHGNRLHATDTQTYSVTRQNAAETHDACLTYYMRLQACDNWYGDCSALTCCTKQHLLGPAFVGCYGAGLWLSTCLPCSIIATMIAAQYVACLCDIAACITGSGELGMIAGDFMLPCCQCMTFPCPGPFPWPSCGLNKASCAVKVFFAVSYGAVYSLAGLKVQAIRFHLVQMWRIALLTFSGSRASSLKLQRQ